MTTRSTPEFNDVVVSKVSDGHLLLIVTGARGDRLSLVYRGSGWNVQYAVARGAKLASGKGGNLWYTADEMTTLEYLETFRVIHGDLEQTAMEPRIDNSAPTVALRD
jgi:hypothetical protein